MHPHKRLLIGLHGLAETGKSTAAAELCTHLALRRYIIARPITLACAAAMGISHEAFLSLPKNAFIEPLGTTKRRMMQRMGDFLLSDSPTALLNLLQDRMAQDENSNYLFNGNLVEDVRTEDEANWIRARGGIVVHIKNSRAQPAPEHRTERGITFGPSDELIANEAGLREFSTTLKQLAERLRHHHGTLQEAS